MTMENSIGISHGYSRVNHKLASNFSRLSLKSLYFIASEFLQDSPTKRPTETGD